MLSHAHAFRPGFALPKAIIRVLRSKDHAKSRRQDKVIAALDARQREDLGLSPSGQVKATRPEA